MSSTRTQVHLTEEQRRRIDQVVESEGVPMAEVISRALDEFLGEDVAPTAALAATFGSAPSADAPSRDG